MQILQDRKRKSEKMSKEEHKAFLKYVGSFPTKVDAAVALGVSRPTLDGLIHRGSGHPDTIQIVRERLSEGIRA